MVHDRRALLRATLIASGALLTQSALADNTGTQNWSAPDADVPSATLRSMVFQSKRLDASTEAYRHWYIAEHGPDYLSFAAPYLERYSRLFVEKAYRGPVDFDCISELAFPSREAILANFKALDTPEGKAALDRHPKIGVKPGPNEAHDGPHRFSTEERLLSGSPRTYDKPGTKLKVVLMRRKTDEAQQEAFVHAVSTYGSRIARERKDGLSRMTLTIAVREPRRAAPLFDAVYVIWPAGKASFVDAFNAPPAEVEVVNVLDVVLYEPDLKAL
jgi:hypothetical protein